MFNFGHLATFFFSSSSLKRGLLLLSPFPIHEEIFFLSKKQLRSLKFTSFLSFDLVDLPFSSSFRWHFAWTQKCMFPFHFRAWILGDTGLKSLPRFMRPPWSHMEAASPSCFSAHEFIVFSLEFSYFAILDLLSLILLIFLTGKGQTQSKSLPNGHVKEQVRRPAPN